MIELYSDGGAQPNPGVAAWAFVIVKDGTRVYSASGIVGDHETNNVAEYHAMFHGVTWLFEHRGLCEGEEIWLVSDSQLLINQLNGSYKVNNVKLRHLHSAIMAVGKLLFGETGVHLKWNPRENEWTSFCDRLCDGEIERFKL